MKYGYYPGCSLEKNAYSYHQSAMAVAKPLGLEFAEVDELGNVEKKDDYIDIHIREVLDLALIDAETIRKKSFKKNQICRAKKALKSC